MSTATAVTEARAGERARTQATDTALGLRILSAVFCVWWSFLDSLATLRACSQMLSRPFQVMTEAMRITAVAAMEARARERTRGLATDMALGLHILSAVFRVWWSFLGDSPCLLTDAFTSFSSDVSGYEDYGCGGYGGKSQGKSKRIGNRHGTWFAQFASAGSSLVVIPCRLSVQTRHLVCAFCQWCFACGGHSLATLRACSQMLSRPFHVMTQAMRITAVAATEARARERARGLATDTALGLHSL